MAKTDYKSIDEYHSAYPDAVPRMQQVRDIIHQVVPDVEEAISYQIPCFKYKGYLIYYAAFPNHISISHPFSAALLEHFKDELKNYKVSKSVIQIPNTQELPVGFIKELIKFRKAENEANPSKKK